MTHRVMDRRRSPGTRPVGRSRRLRGGVGADQAGGVRRSRRDRRWRRPDGAPDRAAGGQVQAVAAAAGRGEQGRRRRCRGLHVREGRPATPTRSSSPSRTCSPPPPHGVPFNWKDLTPVARLALDEFILWVNTDRADKKDYKTAREYIARSRKRRGRQQDEDGRHRDRPGRPDHHDPARAGARAKFIYVPFKGREVCVNLVGNHVDSTVNNPIECAGHMKAGRVRPLGVFDTSAWPRPAGVTSRRQGGPGRGHQLPDAPGSSAPQACRRRRSPTTRGCCKRSTRRRSSRNTSPRARSTPRGRPGPSS